MQASRKVGKESELDSIAPKSVLKYLSCAEKKASLYRSGPNRQTLSFDLYFTIYLAQLQINQAKNKSCTFPFLETEAQRWVIL